MSAGHDHPDRWRSWPTLVTCSLTPPQIGLTLFAMWFARRTPTPARTFGFFRAETENGRQFFSSNWELLSRLEVEAVPGSKDVRRPIHDEHVSISNDVEAIAGDDGCGVFRNAQAD
jgi:hypothetical protein